MALSGASATGARRAHSLLNRKKTPEAVGLFEYAVLNFPDSPNAFDSLAEAYEAAGQWDLAVENCRTACRLGEEQRDERLATFRNHLERVTKKLGG